MGPGGFRHLALFSTASAAITAAAGLAADRLLGGAAGVVTVLVLVGVVGVVSLLIAPRLARRGNEAGWNPAESLETARLRAMARLSLGIAHDLRAPINAVVLNLANLKHALAEFDQAAFRPDRHVETIEMLEDELRRLQRAVETLLSQTVPFSADPSEFSVVDVVQELEFLLRAQARQLHLDLEIATDRALPQVRAPRDWIKQAILNLVVNAFEATPRGGQVAIETRGGDGDRVEITVSDTGSGIPSSVVPRIFTMHVSGQRHGSGIGLATARAAVEAARGSLNLVRTGPDGTEFVIRLPAVGGGAVGQSA